MSKRPRTGRVAEERTSSLGRPRSPPACGAPGEASWLSPSPVQTEGPPPPAPRVKIQPRPEGEEPSCTPLHPAPAAHLRRLVVFLFLLLKKQQHLGTEGTRQCLGPDGISTPGGSGDTKPLAAWRAPPGAELPQHMAWVGCRAQRWPQQVMLTVVALALARNDSRGKHRPLEPRAPREGPAPAVCAGTVPGLGRGWGWWPCRDTTRCVPVRSCRCLLGCSSPRGARQGTTALTSPRGQGRDASLLCIVCHLHLGGGCDGGVRMSCSRVICVQLSVGGAHHLRGSECQCRASCRAPAGPTPRPRPRGSPRWWHSPPSPPSPALPCKSQEHQRPHTGQEDGALTQPALLCLGAEHSRLQ